MKEIILLKSGEIALKGLNRHTFEDVMMANMRRRIADLGTFKIKKSQSTIYVTPESDDADMSAVLGRLQTVFGVSALTIAAVVKKDFDDIAENAVIYLKENLQRARTFKVNAKRSDKSFPMNSPEICCELGGILLDAYPHLIVDVINPDVTVTVEIRETAAYIHVDQLAGAGGIPVGTGGRAALLLSGGIDSPVAGYMMAKRGLELVAVHFASPPYTSDRARQKVISLGEKMLPYTGKIRLFVVPFTELQELIRDRCPEEYFTLLMRRCMMRIAEAIALREDCGGLITGESMGQVASQTLQALGCTDIVTTLPILRPLIGMDKEEIVRIARKIDTFETSILPYEDCCTVFTPKHPKTKPTMRAVAAIEAEMTIPEEMLDAAVANAELTVLSPNYGGKNAVVK
ncbi:MAG: tRNA uracil 4-sulfurtransferase ThiI [Angelakisella sp.]